MINFISTLKLLYKNHRNSKNILRFIRKNGLDSFLSLWNNYVNIANLETWKKFNNKITILAPEHKFYLAHATSTVLNELNIKNEIKIGNDFTTFDDSLHIIICVEKFKKLPKLYICYQAHQNKFSRENPENLIKKLKKALLVLDHSLSDIEYLLDHLPIAQLYYLPISKTKIDQADYPTDQYDVLFYDHHINNRQQNFILELQKHFKVKVISKTYGHELWTEIQKAKVVININKEEDDLLKLDYLYECISNNAIIISESSKNIDEYPELINLVHFTKNNSVDEIIETINTILLEDKNFNNKLKTTLEDKSNNFKFHFCRMLYAQGLIDFNTFYTQTYKNLQPTSNFWCLGLPESTKRQQDFEFEKLKINSLVWKFPAIRHSTPWIGCGLSYKYMIQYAKDNNWPKISICEDDVSFNEDFEEKCNNIQSYLEKNNVPWDIISGHVTDINEHTAIINHLDSTNNTNIFKLNQTTGTVFNIYNESIYSHIINWNHENINLQTNTIDRYIQNKSSLRVITSVPYLVGHKEYLNTTLWDRKAGEFTYDSISEASMKKILESVNQ